MRLSVVTIATFAFGFSLIPTVVIRSEQAAGGAGAIDQRSVTTATEDPIAAWLSSPLPVSAMAAGMPPAGHRNHGAPRIEWFLGYSYLRAIPSPSAGNRLMWLHGGSTSVAINLNRVFGIVGDFGGFNDTRLLLTSGNPPSGLGPALATDDGTVVTYLAGPRLSYGKYNRVTPFVQALFGGVRASKETICRTCGDLLPSQNAFAMTAGAGLDIKVRRHLALRVIQAEYLMTRLDDTTTGATTSQNDMRLSAGVVLRFGGGPAAPPRSPLAYSCSASPSSVFAGEPIDVSGTAVNLEPARTATYTWSVHSGTIAGNGNTARIDTAGLAPGSYMLKGHASDGDRPDANADCTTAYIIKTFEPPTISCSASPSTVVSGASATITASAISPQNSPLTYSYSSTSTPMSGSGTTATLSTTGASAGTIDVTCTVLDDKSQTAHADTSVTVTSPVAAVTPTTSALCSIRFERDSHRPARVDNEGKACLDEVALTLQSSADTKLAIVGNASENGVGGKKLASQRAANAKAYLVHEKGIDSARIVTYSGSKKEKSASTVLIPAGATMDDTGDISVN